ncbi:MAG: hypothetical protein IKL60_05700 [Alistipes sp.]|nr:hypothetical protein [Alistipes sp.]
MHDEYFIDSEEEIREREQAEALRQLVREEVQRAESGEVESGEETPSEEQKRGASYRGFLRWIRHALTGEILITNEVQQLYNAVTVLGIVYLLAIFAMFASFHRAQQYDELQQEVVLLREEAIYSIRNRHLESSHSKILERLKESGVDIQDPYSQPKILK